MSAILVLGGARSGKSRFSENLAKGVKHYIASGQAFDAEMSARIDQHQVQRGTEWTTHEEPLNVLARLQSLDIKGNFVLFDCLTLWLSNLMFAERCLRDEVENLCAFLQSCQAQVVVVSNEVGMGIVPDNALARKFRDEQGFANQAVAAAAKQVVFVAAGLPIALKGRLPK